MSDSLDRRIGLTGSVAIGMSAMIGAGLFVVFPPAIEAAGDGLLLALGLAAIIAACNAFSSAQLASRYPVAGGTYVYGRERLGPFWGYLAGWAFVAGKLASCAAMAFAVGTYVWPEHARTLAVATVVAVIAINLVGVEKSAVVAVVIVSVVVAVVALAVVAMFAGPSAPDTSAGDASAGGVLQAAALLFFAFAGYARLATLGEEVRNPTRTIPRAIATSLALVVALYAVVALSLNHALGAKELADSTRPFVDALDAAGRSGFVPVIQVVAAVAAGGALLSLALGVSRTMFAMARDGHLPRAITLLSGTSRVPRAAELTAGALIIALVLLGDLGTSIAFSSFCVLLYYAIANVAAWTLPSAWTHRAIAAIGFVGCVVLAFNLTMPTIGAGCTVVGIGAVIYVVRAAR
ncbi:APA family basic amino acid/polyamine antiporter [Aeromicrobium panaciterrae]|uniref:APA family basic amino acid/polyamine antiporter n=1 Tax=Aeromicrobium panaciterrae TaxID=363861 RepID=A0ABU1UN80_9ACTN|nr:APC family permease [Aeromicrobium panaciterrae]MDR7086643.1 APA family basic amino acid/polyamine antiporter [Aeromicrobium panaciterrae]